ncbi:MAG: UDP-N-acetylmuramoyl-tripeptide--D-alanyl-D-alanine ligase [Opitutales bacterium]|jgi:UDP-N-acetylmuramoyl-tripeptide--D-alanyl-D-alanine ligase
MATLDPAEAAVIAHGRWATSPPAKPLRSFAIDTRRIEPGETFVALKSDRMDGHSFLRQAFQYRALAALVEHPDTDVPIPQLVVRDSLGALQALARSWRQRFRSPVIGVTGSNGKTTVKEMLGQVLGSQWFRTRGNHNNHIGVPLSLLELDPRMHAGGILEAGINDVGEMDLLSGMINPDHAIITSVGPSHLERLGDLEGVAREKAILARSVRPGGNVFLPAQLLRYAAFRDLPETIRVHALLRRGESIGADLSSLPNLTIYHYNWTDKVPAGGPGILRMEMPVPHGPLSFRAGSDGMVSNLALVVQVALHLGVPLSTLQACLDAWRPFRQRGETVRYRAATYYVDCYNANPGSMLDSLQRFAHLFPNQPHLYVLGTMNELGENAAEWHRSTANRGSLRGDADVYLIGEHAEALAEGLLQQGHDRSRIHFAQTDDELREHLSRFSGAIFLKGSRSLGMERLVPEGGRSC